jgi:trk system potassium uptake protein TrkH
MAYLPFFCQRYQTILAYTGLISLIAGVTILIPLIALLFYPEEINLAGGFFWPGLTLTLLGLFLWLKLSPTQREKGQKRKKNHSVSGQYNQIETLNLPEGAIIILLSWLMAIAFSTIPFLTVGGLNLTQAVFESTSGWTTTGLSVVDVTQASHLLLLFRSLTQLVGGAGFAIIALSAIGGFSGSGLTAAEGRSEQLVPNLHRSAKLVLSIYTGYVTIGIIALRQAGMGWFDAINHAFAALSTGGFSTRAESIGYWNSLAVEMVTIVLMLCGTLNFLTSYLILKGKLQAVIRNGEVRLQFLLIPLAVLILLTGITLKLYSTFPVAIRVAIFASITALSTTGYSTVDYVNWNGLGLLVLILLMIIGGGSGSTAGGIKQYRIYVLYRALQWEIRRLLLPKNTVTEPSVWQGDHRHFLSDSQIRPIAVFFWLYLLVYGLGTLILTAYGYSLEQSLFEYASVLSTVGLSVGITAADAPEGLLWTEIIGMFLGRLEFLPVLVGINQIWRDLVIFWDYYAK